MSHTGAISKGGARPKVRNAVKVPTQIEEDYSVPLEKKLLRGPGLGIQADQPALDKIWVQKYTFMSFTAPPELKFEDGTPIVGASEAWVEQMEFLESDLKTILELPHHRFWSQIVYDSSIHDCLESFLTNRPRWFETINLDELMETILKSIDQLMFLVLLRMATYKESKADHITPSVFGELIYKNYIFDSCNILDICMLYGSSNKAVLEKMLNNIFTHQPMYFGDLKILTASLLDAFENVEVQLGIGNALRLGNGSNTVPLLTLHDVIMYLMDIFAGLHSFFTIVPKAVTPFHEYEYETRLSAFYEKIIPTISEHLAAIPITSADYSWASELEDKLNLARLSALAVFNVIIDSICLQPLKTQTANGHVVEECMSQFVHIMNTCSAETAFVTDYNSIYNISEHLECLKSSGADMTNLDFISQAVDFAQAESSSVWPAKLQPDQNGLSAEDASVGWDTSGMNGYCAAENNSISPVDEACLVSNIQELLSELGAGFIKKCLKYYNYSTEDVLNAILENSLPSCLDILDRTMVDEEIPMENVVTEPTNNASTKEDLYQEEFPSLVSQRVNIYNDDEFDIFSSNNIDVSRIHKGKKPLVLPEADDELKAKLKQIGKAYDDSHGFSIYEDEEKYRPFTVQDYNDEYDDTYDDDDAGGVDTFGGDKKTMRFPNMRGRGALNKPLPESEESSAGETEDQSESKDIRDRNGTFRRQTTGYHQPRFPDGKKIKEKPFIPFCQNPEVLRHKAEERRQSKRGGNKGWKRDDEEPGQPAPAAPAPAPAPAAAAAAPAGGNQAAAARPKVNATRNTGKTWREGDDPEDPQGSRGGKYKKACSHGKVQDKDHRHKMIHKNDHKRQGAQKKEQNRFP